MRIVHRPPRPQDFQLPDVGRLDPRVRQVVQGVLRERAQRQPCRGCGKKDVAEIARASAEMTQEEE